MIAIPIVFLVILALASALAAAYDASQTGYYLPKGYKVTAKIHVPGSPFLPGEIVGDIVGVATSDYSVLAVGYGWKGQVWEGWPAESGIKIVWKERGLEDVKAKDKYDEGDYDVTIVYGCDGQVKFSVNGEFIYGFVATTDRYSIVAEGAKVYSPEPLPCLTETTTNPTGTGYNPPSIPEQNQMFYTMLGIGAAAILVPLGLVLARKR